MLDNQCLFASVLLVAAGSRSPLPEVGCSASNVVQRFRAEYDGHGFIPWYEISEDGPVAYIKVAFDSFRATWIINDHDVARLETSYFNVADNAV
jgi:hypothetical protein